LASEERRAKYISSWCGGWFEGRMTSRSCWLYDSDEFWWLDCELRVCLRFGRWPVHRSSIDQFLERSVFAVLPIPI